jgi:hypothetical protein
MGKMGSESNFIVPFCCRIDSFRCVRVAWHRDGTMKFDSDPNFAVDVAPVCPELWMSLSFVQNPTIGGCMKRGAFAIMLVLSTTPCGAQLLELQPGARVRVTAPGILGGRLDGTIGARHGDTLSVVQQGVAPVNLPISAMTSVEVYRGKSRGAGAKRGLLWGAAIGLPLGALTAAGDNKEWNGLDATCDSDFEDCPTTSDLGMVAWTTFSFATVGAGIGALIGRAHWDKLQVPVRSAFVMPSKRSIGIGVNFRF